MKKRIDWKNTFILENFQVLLSNVTGLSGELISVIKPIRHAKSTMVHISVNTIPLYFFCWKWQLILIPESKPGPCVFQRSACIVDSVRLTYTEYESLQIQLGVLSPSVVEWVCLLCFYLKRFWVYRQERTDWEVKAWGRLGCCDHGIVEFGFLRGENQVNSRITTLDFRRTDFGLFGKLLGGIPWDTVLTDKKMIRRVS